MSCPGNFEEQVRKAFGMTISYEKMQYMPKGLYPRCMLSIKPNYLARDENETPPLETFMSELTEYLLDRSLS